MLPTALSKAELATAMPVSGGPYVYIDRTFGPLASTISGLGLWLSLLLKSAFALVGFGAYLRVLTDAPPTAVGLGLLILIAWLNIVGVRKVGKAQVWVVLLVIASLTILSSWGLAVGAEAPADFFTHGAGGFLATVSFVFISYAGITKVAAVAEEVQRPERNLPIGILASLGIVTAIYATVIYALVASVPVAALEGDLRPIHTLAHTLGGPAVGVATALLGVLTMTSMANAGLLAASRFPFAMSRDHLLPPQLGHVNRRYLTPAVAIVATALLMAASILFLDVAGIAKLASSLMIVGFVLENVAVIVLRESRTKWYAPTFRSPLYPAVQILGIVLGLALLGALGWSGVVAMLAIVVPGFVIFALVGRQKTRRQGVLGRLGPQRDLLGETGNVRPEGLEAFEPEMRLPESAAVFVPLDGSERSPEASVEIGGALAAGARVAVARLTEVPEQLSVDVDLRKDLQIGSLRRRMRLLAEDRGYDLAFDAFSTRDTLRTVHDISRRVDCRWVVLDWQDRIDRGLLPFTPRGWLFEHLECNLAVFKDAGIRAMRELLVLAEPGPHDALVALTADHLAAVYGAKLTFVRFVHVDAPPIDRQAEVDYVEKLSQLCSASPRTRVLRGRNDLEELTKITAGYDLLVMGAPPEARFGDIFRGGSFAERLTRAAACSVLRLKTPRRRAHDAVDSASTLMDPTHPKLTDLSPYLVPECLVANVEEGTKEALFEYFARAFAKTLDGVQAAEIEAALWSRERTQNTSIDRGMALPHATLRTIDRAWLGVFTARSPVEYKSPDGRPIDVFFVTLSPPSARDTHLRILAGLSKLVLDTTLLDDLRAATDAAGLRRALDTAAEGRSARPRAS